MWGVRSCIVTFSAPARAARGKPAGPRASAERTAGPMARGAQEPRTRRVGPATPGIAPRHDRFMAAGRQPW